MDADTSQLAARGERVARALAKRLETPANLRVVLSPYRVCPLGAHIDHQHGPVLGTAIDVGTALAFAPQESPEVVLHSDDFAGSLRFRIDDEAPGEGWERYARAAVRVLAERLPQPPRGFVGQLSGHLPGGGLSSSASVLVGYLLALAHVNDIALAPSELVRLAVRAENEFVGVRCGVLDPAAIVGSEAGRLLEIDTRAVRWRPLSADANADAVRFLIVFSGQSRVLSSTPFNARVAECRSAAARIADRHGHAPASRLGDLPEDLLEAGIDALPDGERGRARHFLEERRRVRAGVQAWTRGDFRAFGELMWDSCRSSIENYETGSDEQERLQQILRETPGVVGARFSGAGYGGCNVALVEAATAAAAAHEVLARYRAAVPALAAAARTLLVQPADGARVVLPG
ncbi:MAG: galactokinase family protein [Myxococcota bacterium]